MTQPAGWKLLGARLPLDELPHHPRSGLKDDGRSFAFLFLFIFRLGIEAGDEFPDERER
jgi:hypothetical protein